jgi:uncharacterized protein YgbK (DUF1537 family)
LIKEEALKQVEELKKKVLDFFAKETERLKAHDETVERLKREVAETKEEQRKTGEAIEKAKGDVQRLESKMKAYEKLEGAFAEIIENVVDKKFQGMNPGGVGERVVGLVHVKTTVHVREEKRTLPAEFKTTTPDGKILKLAADGGLEGWKRPTEFIKLFPFILPQTVRDALDRLVEKELLVKKKETGSSNTVYSRHPDVEYK